MTDLEEAVTAARQAVESTPEDHPDRATLLNNLGNKLESRYERTGEMTDLEEAIMVARQAVASTSEDHPGHAALLNNLGNKLESRYERMGEITDLEEAITIARQAVESILEEYPDHAALLSNLANKLGRRYERTGEITDLEKAITIARQAVKLTLEDYPDRAGRLTNLGIKLIRWYERTGKMADLEDAITVARQAVESTPEDHPDRASRLTNLANMLESRYERTGGMANLNEAVTIARQALESKLENHPYHAAWLNNLGNKLESRYERTGEITDLEEAITIARQAVDSTPKDHPSRATWLNNLANKLGHRYERKGEMTDLEKAITITRQAVDSTPEDHPDYAAWLNNLGIRLGYRYERMGEMTDLEKAIIIVRQAVESTPEDHPGRAGKLTNLGNMFGIRYERTGEIANLKEAITIARQAVESTPEGHSDRASRLNNLGIKLGRWYEQTGEMADLKKAIAVTRQAVESTPENHPKHATWLNNLGIMLGRWYERTGKMTDLEDAIIVARQAVESTPEDHPDRAGRLTNLGNKLESRYERTDEMADLDTALHCFLCSSKMLQAPPLIRVQSSRAAIQILQDGKRWIQAIRVAEDALRLLPLICSRYLSLDDQQHAITQTSGLAADACSLALRTGNIDKALQQLEFGRGLILSYMIDSRSDLSALRRDSPTLTDRYEILHSKASRHIDDQAPAIRDQLLKERREAAREIEDCLNKIRQIPGHKRFLMEPPIDELKSLAVEGPIVVINVTNISADAIILTRDQAKALSLPGLSSKTAPPSVRQLFEQYTSFSRGDYHRDIAPEIEAPVESVQLSWLWSNCVKLVLGELEAIGFLMRPEAPRVWWVGSGIANSFPFHAAGIHSESPTENTLSQVVSSYTPTIRALGYSRSRASERAQTDDKNVSVLVVTMPTTPGQKPLSGVGREKRAIEKACRGIYSYEELQLPTTDEVLEKIPMSDIAHFACHGSSHRTNPSDSHLLLQRSDYGELVVDRLTVSRISSVITQGRAWIAFLSACSTAEVKAGKLTDEGIHLVSAFQVAGFAHVIGSLWSADDNVCVRVAEVFYGDLTRHGETEFSSRSVAVALRNAVMQVRSEFCGSPYMWAPFVHFGA